MKLILYFVLIITADAINRLQIFRKHHNGRLGQKRSLKTNRSRHTHTTTSIRKTMNSMISKHVVKQMCNIKTCTKCNKMIEFDHQLGNKYCFHILRIPDCCSKDNKLYSKFWNFFELLKSVNFCHLSHSLLPISVYFIVLIIKIKSNLSACFRIWLEI